MKLITLSRFGFWVDFIIFEISIFAFLLIITVGIHAYNKAFVIMAAIIISALLYRFLYFLLGENVDDFLKTFT